MIDWSSGKETGRLTGHTQVITGLTFSPDNKLLVTGSFDKTIKVWDIASGKEKMTLTGHTDAVCSLVFTPDSKTLISGGNDKHVRLWDVESWKEKAQIEQPDTGPQLAVARDGKTLATANFYRGVRLWDLATGKEKGKLRALHDGASRVAISPDGKTLAVGHFHGTIKTFDLTQGIPVLAARKSLDQGGFCSRIAVSADGQRLGVSDRGGFTLWDLGTFQRVVTHNRIYAQIMSYDGKTIATADSGSVKLLDATSGMARGAVTGRFDSDSPVALSRDGKWIATGNTDKTVTVWELATGKARASLKGFEWELKLLAFSPDGKLLAAGDGKKLKVWEWGTSKVKNDLESRITCLAFSADGKLLAIGDTNAETDVWDIATDKSKATVCGHGNENTSVALSPDGKLLATASKFPVRYGATTTPLPRDDTDPVLRLWDATTGKPLAICYGHREDVSSLAFSPDSKSLFSSSDDQTIKVWDIPALAPKPN